jgi:hypothetical protein
MSQGQNIYLYDDIIVGSVYVVKSVMIDKTIGSNMINTIKFSVTEFVL